MAMLKNEDTGVNITRFVSLTENQEVIRTTQRLLSGAVYIQRIGEPAVSYAVTAYVQEDGKALLMEAENTAALLSVTVRRGTFYGRIIGLSFSGFLADGWVEATLMLAKEVDE